MTELTLNDALIAIIFISIVLIIVIIITSIKREYIIKNNFLDEIISKNKKYEEEQYKKLTKMVFGNKKTAERLVSIEQGITPKEPRIKLIKSAINRLERNNKR
ncbi:MAG: hypothetical protein PHI97_24295 [Desulfobulbus sp.]|nr:hypothetical protein [Desulfobulbus sp.]